MKSKIYSLLAMSMLLFTGCDDWSPNDQQFPDGTGGISTEGLKLTVTDAPSEATNEGRAEGDYDVNSFIVEILNSNGSVANNGQAKWTYGQMPEVVELPIGEYTVHVKSLEKFPDAEFDTPFYEGTSESVIRVTNNQISDLGTVNCKFQSLKVKVVFAESMLTAMSPDSKVEVIAGETNVSTSPRLTWTATNNSAIGYFNPGESSTLAAVFTGTVGTRNVNQTRVFVDVKKGNYYILTFRATAGSEIVPDRFGEIDPSGIDINTEITEIEQDGNVNVNPDKLDPSNRPDKEDWPDPNPGGDPEPGPTTDPITITPTSSSFNLDGVNIAAEGEWAIDIVSENPLANIEVTIESPYLTDDFLQSVGMRAQFNLANPGELEEALLGFGFPIKENVVGKKQVRFEISPFIPLINLAASMDIYGVHTFNLKVSDDQGNVKNQALKFENIRQ